MNRLANDFEQAFNQIGLSMMPNDFAAQLLSYVYVLGGSNEHVVMNEGLNAGIQIAQRKFNIFGGCVPSEIGILLIQKYSRDLEIYEMFLRNDKKLSNCLYTIERINEVAGWCYDIEKRYNFQDSFLKHAVKQKLCATNE